MLFFNHYLLLSLTVNSVGKANPGLPFRNLGESVVSSVTLPNKQQHTIVNTCSIYKIEGSFHLGQTAGARQDCSHLQVSQLASSFILVGTTQTADRCWKSADVECIFWQRPGWLCSLPCSPSRRKLTKACSQGHGRSKSGYRHTSTFSSLWLCHFC